MHFSFIILKHIYVLISFDLSAKSNLSYPAHQSRHASCFDWPNKTTLNVLWKVCIPVTLSIFRNETEFLLYYFCGLVKNDKILSSQI